MKVRNFGVVTTNDIKRIALAEEPYVVPAIQMIWCLSGRTSVLGDDVDNLNRAFDPKDDYTRMQRAIAIADEVNAKLARKSVRDLTNTDRVIPIYYNGRTKHNDALREALNKNMLPYPKELFIIESISPENTIGQVQGFEKFLRKRGQDYQTIAVVTSEFHRLRVACTLGNKSLQTRDEFGASNALVPRNYFIYGIDKLFTAPGSDIDIASEPTTIMNYSSWFRVDEKLKKPIPPSISRSSSSNIFLLQSEVFNFIQQKASDYLRATLRYGLFSPKILTASLDNGWRQEQVAYVGAKAQEAYL